MSEALNNPRIILASKSPRRRYLLEKAGLEFSVFPSEFDESSVRQSSPETYVKLLAESKAKDISEKYPESWVIGADTVVLIDNRILGKPASRGDARRMLTRLSARKHHVMTGYCIRCKSREILYTEMVATEVYFKDLSREEIEWYIHTPEPFDKAGAYAIQGLGTFLVKRINGSYSNVVGLPVCEVIEFLIKENVVGLNVGTHKYS